MERDIKTLMSYEEQFAFSGKAARMIKFEGLQRKMNGVPSGKELACMI